MKAAIGVIGGVGPYAGIDLVGKIFDNTIANKDQDHIDLYLTSLPGWIGDRTNFLLNGGDNPAEGLLMSLRKLVAMGANVIGIPCNTAHAPSIYSEVRLDAAREFPEVKLLNMIDETSTYIANQFPQGATVGLMATQGTHAVGLYRQYLASHPQIRLIEPDAEGQRAVHEAIYHPDFGIKAVSPVTDQARRVIQETGRKLIDAGASALILGCTELPLALRSGDVDAVLIDPTLLLARAAIRAASPEKLRPS